MDKNEQEIKELIIEQKKYVFDGELKNVKERIVLLKRLKHNIIISQNEITQALKLDLNKSEVESYMTEIGTVLSEISFMIKHLKSFARPKRVRTPISNFPAKSYRLPCAYGSVLIISPWNYPFMLAIEPLVDAISAGNSVILKPSGSTPNVSQAIKNLIEKTFSPKQCYSILGSSKEYDFLLDLDFDYIFFTGSTRVGQTVLQKASAKFIPVTLEMGGKSPAIVDETANIELSAKRIVFGKFLNCGQTCVACDYVYCSEKIKDKLVKEIEKQIVLQYSVDPISNDSYPRMINEKQFDHALNLIDKNKLVFGGKCDKSLLKIEPTIVDADFDDACMQEEIFGPVLPIVTFENVDQAIEKINSLNPPLALYVFSNDKTVQNKVVSKCRFGGGCINDTIMHIANSNLAFGGFKQSGIGSYHGKVGFETFSHTKSIVKKRNWLDLPLRYQPFSKLKYKLIKMFLK